MAGAYRRHEASAENIAGRFAGNDAHPQRGDAQLQRLLPTAFADDAVLGRFNGAHETRHFRHALG